MEGNRRGGDVLLAQPALRGIRSLSGPAGGRHWASASRSRLSHLNAKSAEWGSPVTDVRGEALADWTGALGLSVLNRGSEHTCVRQMGGSIVDVLFASPAALRMVRGWRVETGVETLGPSLYSVRGLRLGGGDTPPSPERYDPTIPLGA